MTDAWKSFLTAKTFADRLNDFIEQYELAQLPQNPQLRHGGGTEIVEISGLLQKLAHQLSYNHRYTKDFAEEFVSEYSGFEYMLGALSILQRWLFEMSAQQNTRFSSLFHRSSSAKYRSAGKLVLSFGMLKIVNLRIVERLSSVTRDEDDNNVENDDNAEKYCLEAAKILLENLVLPRELLLSHITGVQIVLVSVNSPNIESKCLALQIIVMLLYYVDTFSVIYKSLTLLAGQNRDDSRLTIIVSQLKYGIKHSNFRLQTLAMRLLNKLFSQAPNFYYKIIIQAEAETAGFSILELEKALNDYSQYDDFEALKTEVLTWKATCLPLTLLQSSPVANQCKTAGGGRAPRFTKYQKDEFRKMFPSHFWKSKKDKELEKRRWSIALAENVDHGLELDRSNGELYGSGGIVRGVQTEGFIDRNPFYEDLKDSLPPEPESVEDVTSRYEVYSPTKPQYVPKRSGHFLKHRTSSSTDSKASDRVLPSRSPCEERIFENFSEESAVRVDPFEANAPNAVTVSTATKPEKLFPAGKHRSAKEVLLRRVGTNYDNSGEQRYRQRKTAGSSVAHWKSVQDLTHADYEPRPSVYFGGGGGATKSNGVDSFYSAKAVTNKTMVIGPTTGVTDRPLARAMTSNDDQGNIGKDICYHSPARSWSLTQLPVRRAKTPTAFEEKVFHRSSRPIAQIIGTRSASGSSYECAPLAENELTASCRTNEVPLYSADSYRRTVIQVPYRSGDDSSSSVAKPKVAFASASSSGQGTNPAGALGSSKFKPSLKHGPEGAGGYAASFMAKPVKKTVSYYGDEIEDALKRFDYLNDYSMDEVSRKTKFSVT